MLRIIDLEGKQAVDFLCYNATDPSERYNAADTMKYAGTIFLTAGHGLYSDMGRRLFTIVDDTCGRHDTIGGCCSAESNEVRYERQGARPSCRQNFLRALAPFGLGKKDIVANVNWFMNVPVGPDGTMGDRRRALEARATTSTFAPRWTCSPCSRIARRRATRATASIRPRSAWSCESEGGDAGARSRGSPAATPDRDRDVRERTSEPTLGSR